jgi:hypothetical protein
MLQSLFLYDSRTVHRIRLTRQRISGNSDFQPDSRARAHVGSPKRHENRKTLMKILRAAQTGLG